jgi:hypothetical protein
MKTNIKQSLIAATVIVAFSVFTGCTGGGGGDSDGADGTTAVNPEFIEIAGDQLKCGRTVPAEFVDGYNPDDASAVVSLPADLPIQRINISKRDVDDVESKENPNAQNNLKRMTPVVSSAAADGTLTGAGYVHPLIVSYAEQVVGPYELGDGSADIGDPNTIDDIFTSLSLDNGKTWKKVNVSNTADKTSIKVNWTDGTEGGAKDREYFGHSHKPTMMVNGKQILVAWHDKYCPSGDPLGLYVKDEVTGEATDVLVDPTQPDYYKVNGKQGSINYKLDGLTEETSAPNGKAVWEVPFSCVWTARGVMNTDDENNVSVTWYKPEQLTSGTRDANKVWIATSWDTTVGFALAWQEDPEGLRQGQGAGPGEGWSGATTNHGADIWYTHIAADKFEEAEEILDEDNVTKLKAVNNFAYPVRVTDNEVCKEGDTKLYCQDIPCTSYVVSKDEEPTDDATAVTSGKCVTNVLDPLWDDGTTVILDGDTGASRPAMSILKTNEDVDVVIFAYEETKGLSESNSASQDQGETETEIEYEGKVALFNSFPFNNPIRVNAGTIVNPKAPDANDTTKMIYENARRVVIVNQIDACDQKEGDFTFGIMYKQGIETRGGSSDMFVRMNRGFQADTFVAADEVKNLSSMPLFDKEATPDASPEDFWTSANLEDQTWTNLNENTFSPRGFMRGSDIFIGYEYTPNWAQTEQGNEPNTFYMNRFVNGAWEGPKEISKVVGRKVSTLDPRFFPTPKERYTLDGEKIVTDKSNPNILFLTYGTFDMESGLELDLFYTYSTDYGATWNHVQRETADGNVTADAKLAAVDGIEEKEVQTIVSPDGTMIWNAWLQEEDKEHYDANLEILDEDGNAADHFGGLDSWSGRVDFNATEEVE